MENTTKGMITCKVCRRDFALIIEEHYVAKESSPTGLAALAGSPRKLFDVFDCPHCGCQNVVNGRYPLTDIMGQDLPLSYEEKEEEEGCCCCGSDACKLNKGEQE